LLASREQRDDQLTALEEGYDDAFDKFGPVYAHWWAVSQVIRSVPYWVWALIIKIGAAIWKTG